jgi:hypothetical protein
MSALKMFGVIACVSVFLATGAVAEILGVQPGTSDNPKDNVPKEIQRGTPGGGTFGPGGTGPGTRDVLVDMNKEKPAPVTQQQLDQNAAKTHEGGAALAAETLGEKSMDNSKKSMKSTPQGTAKTRSGGNDGPKKDPQTFQQQRSDKSQQGQELINTQAMEKQ